MFVAKSLFTIGKMVFALFLFVQSLEISLTLLSLTIASLSLFPLLFLIDMVREFNESRLSRDAFGYYVFSMKCSQNNDIFVYFRAVVCNGRVCSMNADFVHPAMSSSWFAEENRHFLRQLNLYLRTGISSVKEEEEIEARLDL